MGDSIVEKIHIEEFLALVEELEVSNWGRQLAPEPDFWAETNLGLIGIEHTRLFKKVDQNKVDPVLHENEGDEVLKLALEIFHKQSDVKVHVSVSFRSDYGVGRQLKNPIWLHKNMRIKLAEELVQFVLTNLPKDEEFLDFENPNPWTGDYMLSEVISSVNIGHFSKMNHSYFGASGAHVSPSLENARIFETLEKKNTRPHKYQRNYKQIWLVMITSPFQQTMDFDFNRSKLPEIETTFNRVFIYRHGEKKYHELPKVSR